MLLNVELNYLGIIVATVANMILGMLWYGPLLGKAWIKEMGYSKKEVDVMQKEPMGKTMLAATVASLIIATTLSILITSLEAASMLEASLLAILLWFGFIASTFLNAVLWEKKSVKLYLINIFYYFVSLIIMAKILFLI